MVKLFSKIKIKSKEIFKSGLFFIVMHYFFVIKLWSTIKGKRYEARGISIKFDELCQRQHSPTQPQYGIFFYKQKNRWGVDTDNEATL